MTGLALTGGAFIGWSGSDTQWKIVGTGDFGSVINGVSTSTPDGKPDILRQHEAQDISGIWLMNGTAWNGGLTVNVVASHDWRMMGAGDFGSMQNGQPSSIQDGKADIVWQQTGTDTKSFWIMNGGAYQQGFAFDYWTPGWRIVAVGDFGSSPSNTTPDGKPDLVLSNFGTGQLMVRYMNGITMVSDHLVWNTISDPPAFFTFAHEKDLQVVGAGDYTGDGKTDVLVRHSTDGRHWVWGMNGTNFLQSWQISSQGQPIHTYETDWRMHTQDLSDSTWRLTQHTNAMVTAVGVPGSPARIDFTVREHPALAGSQTFDLRRRPAGSGSYQTIQSGLTSFTFSDSTAALNTWYDYEVQAVAFGNNGVFMRTTAAVGLQPVHSRGRLLLIVDGTLYNQIGSTSIDTLIKDLAGDGWTVIPKFDAPRHQDPNWTSANASNVGIVKQWIKDRYDEAPASTKSVLILGHVTIPYSGNDASDDHLDHKGPWTADAYYGDAAGPAWTDSGNGQFTNDYFPSPLELAVGRIDFARLNSFLSSTTEAALIQQYIAMSGRYRRKEAPFPLQEKMIFTTYFTHSSQAYNAKRAGHVLFPGGLGAVTIGEPFRNNWTFQNAASPPVPALWAIAAGGGLFTEIYNNGGSGITYTTPMVKNNYESPIAFWMLNGSYFADFNADDNLPRSIIAKPDYGLVVLPTSSGFGGPKWHLERFALGDPIGLDFLATFTIEPYAERWLTLVGDPTLRYNMLTPPTLNSATVNGSMAHLNWTAGETGSQYHVYRAATTAGPFTLLTTSAPLPTSTLSNQTADDSGKRVRMVRGL